MTVDKKEGAGKELTLMISGRIDTDTAGELREIIDEVPSDVSKLILDFRDVPYISSAGLRELLVCRKRFQGDRLLISNGTEGAMQIFEVTGFDSMLPIEAMHADLSTYINLSIKELLARMAGDEGDRVVLKSEHDAYTWSDIDKASQIMAEDMSRLGIGRGTHVGICGANSVNWILSFFALQKLGALAMLMNPAQSAEEIGRVCAIGDIEYLCYGEMSSVKDEEGFMSELKNFEGCRIKAFYSIRNNINVRLRFNEYENLRGKFEGKVDHDTPCVVIFTSGSTGHPKGVILSSYNLLNAASVQVGMQDVTYDDRSLLIVPLFHILGLVVCFLPCAMTGAELFIPDDIRTDTLIRIMKKEKCTLLHSVPTMIIALINNKSFEAESFASLRCTFLAGAATSESQLKMFREKLPNDHFMIGYGLSEMAPVSVTRYEDTEEHMMRTVGKPIDNIKIKIQNRDTGEDMPAGESGEILIQGFNLMTGYYKLPIEEQAIDENGWLHTGDMGSLDEEGYLTLSGRYKELIIRGGENIMPQEVADAVSALEGVKDAKVVGVPSDFFGEEVCACICPDGSMPFNEEQARVKLKEKLAKYKIPSYFLIYDRLPTLATGKVDMVALKKDAAKRILSADR
jgi:fatty-acyl-CoA synthase